MKLWMLLPFLHAAAQVPASDEAPTRSAPGASAPVVQKGPGGAPTPVPDVGDAGSDGDGSDDAASPDVERYDGSTGEGLDEVRRLAHDGDTDGALAVTDSLLVPGPLSSVRARLERSTGGLSERALASVSGPLSWFGVPADEPSLRAEVHYARGLVYAQRADLEPSQESFELARVLAGPGATRHDAVYNQGTLHFLVGESMRQMIPEIAGDAAVEVPEGMEEDPLELARAAYLAARERYVERLASDWRDADTRANVELVLKRLDELDEVEREREEQEQEQQDQDQEQQDDQQQDQEQEQQEDQDQQQEGDQQQDGEQEESEEEPEDEQEEQEPDEEQESDEEPSDEEGEQEQEAQAEPQEEQEKHLTEEEVKRLLERLQQLDEKGEELRERLRGVRRVPVKKDW